MAGSTHVRSFLLASIERAWQPARVFTSPAEEADAVEHSHWNWRDKELSTALGKHRLIAIECSGDVQGLMATLAEPRLSVREPTSNPLLYVDYVETAPWNLEGRQTRPRFLGIGTTLIAEAIRLSVEAGWSGRIGLHSLPQAERFYAGHCQMSLIGPDPNYYGLSYFEYTQEQAIQWLNSVGLSA